MKWGSIAYIKSKETRLANLLATQVDKSDLQVYPYFWQTYGPIARYQAKSRDKLVNHSCQLL